MAYVIAEPCIGTKDASCVDVCPVDCIAGAPSDAQLFIDPETCIDCGACVSACPVEAIYAQSDLPEKWQEYIAINTFGTSIHSGTRLSPPENASASSGARSQITLYMLPRTLLAATFSGRQIRAPECIEVPLYFEKNRSIS